MPFPRRPHPSEPPGRARRAAPRHASPAGRDPRAALVTTARGVGVPALLAAVVTSAAPGWTTYLVRPGETLSGIAGRYDTTVPALVRANGLPAHGNLVFAGVPLRVPVQGGPGPAVSRPTHTVVPGDTLWALARRYGTTVGTLQRWNGLDSALIRPGQELRVGTRKAGSSSASSASSANTFAGRTYPDEVVAAAARNREILASRSLPSREQMRALIVSTARERGVDPALALAVSWQEAGWRQDRVSVANAVGAMQVIPSTGEWISEVLGRRLDLLDPRDNVTAGVVLLKILRGQAREAEAIAGYYQGLASVRRNGMYADTKAYVANIQALKKRFG